MTFLESGNEPTAFAIANKVEKYNEDLFVEEPSTVGEDSVDEAAVRRLALALEKRTLANQEARTKYADQPKRFMDSEIELQETLEEMQILAANPSLYHILASQTRPVSLLLGLLSHENTDIALAVLDLLYELFEPRGLAEAGREATDPLIDAMVLQGHLGQLMAHNLSRMDETSKDEAEGVHKTLGI
ncbi:unnamed protein product [Protopolystoma xenopodis]|uniref:Beta-catenin-like protein 1 N-terminal domain-containing protein n=1 Tax=Protopolystoma xenopodis TaxID=117903 RepID=A0A3S5CKI4_9PLAT|nr:unnamed protein product [Protopolystoma xenopodis]